MKRRFISIFLLMMLLTGTALCETAWIHTGKGALNMRKEASAKADIVKKIPDGERVEVIMEDGEWSRIEYKGKKGYVKSEFLNRGAAAAGSAQDAEERQSAPADGASASAKGESLLQQGGFAWIHTGSGRLNMRRKADAKSSVVAEAPDGERVAVESAGEKWTRIEYKGKSGYVKTEYLRLDAQMIGKTVYPDEGSLYVLAEEEEGSRCLASVHAAQGMTILELSRDWAKVAVQAPVYGDVQGYVSLKSIAQLRESPVEGAMAQMNAHMTLSADKLEQGDAADVTVLCDDDAQCLLYLARDGETVFDGLPLAYHTFSYCPRESGVYEMEVIASRADGNAIGCRARFTVEPGAQQAEQGFELYSQKDGTWLDVKYGRSNMDQSGCAIFTLSHALRLLGYTQAEASPQALADTYPMYLTESGTVTENLINAAARDFGFSGGKEKIKNADKIAQYFEQGAVFSFSVASGHIALAAGLSEDGTKAKIVDSAPSATFERIENAQLYYVDESGAYQAAESLWDIPGARYYAETNEFGGLEYYLDLSYVARRGVRMMKPKN